MKQGLAFRPIDADTHYYEQRDAFTRYIDPKHRDRAVRPEIGPDGREILMAGSRPFTFLPGWSYEKAAPPGALREMLRGLQTEFRTANRPVQDMEPAFVQRGPRLQRMDEHGVEAAVLLPTLGVTVEHFLKDDIDALYANLHAFNRWLDDEWGFDFERRIFAPPLISLADRDQAEKELTWALERGARIVHLRPGPAFGRSPADPHFDRFWGIANEARVTVALHISESGYNEAYSADWGEAANPASHRQSAFQWTNFFGDRPIMDTISALILHNLFGRYPNVRLYSVENGSLWVPYLLKVMDKMKGMGRNGNWLGGRVDGRPSEIFKEHVFVSPHHEEDVQGLARLIGPERVVFGSDYPHPEGVREPIDYLECLDGLDGPSIERIMRSNALELLGLPATVQV